MVTMNDFHKITGFEWEIPRKTRKDLRVGIHVFASQEMLLKGLKDRSFEQAMNAATLPGLVGEVVVMPDFHQGYGFPIGGVAATQLSNGVISPGAIGYDINCGVRLLVSSIQFEQARSQIEILANRLFQECPSGVGAKGTISLTKTEMDQVCREGSRWALKHGFATQEDLELTEDSGCLEDADPLKVSVNAHERGKTQLGSLGSGNHFLEVDVVVEIFDKRAAEAMGLNTGCVCLMIHCGSRGFGHQICTDYVHDFQMAIQKYRIQLPDRELVCAPLNSPEGQAYIAAMRCAANFAFCNRQILANSARLIFRSVFNGKVRNPDLLMVYDLAHNMAKFENHIIENKQIRVCVHRKGATRSFGPGSGDIPDRYQETGQPVLVPGSMGSSSWVLVGTQTAMIKSFGSCCHGAGRALSRSQAKREISGSELRSRLQGKGIFIKTGSLSSLSEEAPEAYKEVDEVVQCVIESGLAKKVARLRPVAVIKG